MSARPAWFLAGLCALLAAGAGAWGWTGHLHLRHAAEALDFAERRAALLEKENNRLHELADGHEKAAARAGDAAKRKALEAAVEDIRGLKFKHPVTYDILPRDGFKQLLEQKMGEQFSDQDFKNVQAGLTALGLLEPGYPLKEKYISLLGEQIAAFYDQHQHKLFMFEDATLDSMQNCIVLAHELTHALQDQHFDLLAMPLEVKDNDDLAIATSALIEGDATVLMTDYTMKNFTLKALSENLSSVYSQNMDQLKTAPRYLREMLIFPYLRGQEFCNALSDQGGYDAITDAFKNPPVSTTQILHPAKYFAHEMPIRVEWADSTVLGKKAAADNVLGEFGIRILLSQWLDDATGKQAAGGWRGDRYFAYEDGTALVWKTIWEDEAIAERFAIALQACAAKRFPHAAFAPAGDSISFSSPAATGIIRWQKGEKEVTFIWASKKEMSDALVQKFITAK